MQVAIVQFAGGGRQADPAEQVVDARLRRVELRIEEALLRVEHVEVGARADVAAERRAPERGQRASTGTGLDACASRCPSLDGRCGTLRVMMLWTRLEREASSAVLDALSQIGDVANYVAEDSEVEWCTLPFYERHRLYRLVNRATLPPSWTHFLADGERFLWLDGTANPIYTASENDPVRLTDATAVPYVEFFFTYVQGSEGEVLVIRDPRRAPQFESLDVERLEAVCAAHQPVRVERDGDTGGFQLRATMFYGGGLIASDINISGSGKLSFRRQTLLLKPNVPAFDSCFISHSFTDAAFASKLNFALNLHGVRTWMSQKDIRGGEPLDEQLIDGIRKTDRLLIVLSDASMRSQWVATEILEGRQRERSEGKRILFPVRIIHFEKLRTMRLFDADEGRDLGREIRGLFIPDFSGWEDDLQFSAPFEEVLRSLRKKKPAWTVGERR